MGFIQIVLGLFLIAGIFAVPVTAFAIDNLTVDIREKGDAQISVDYSLTWVERVFLFMRIIHPDEELEKALEGLSGRNVTVTRVNPAGTELYIEDIVGVDENPEGTLYTTPAMDFSIAEQQLKPYGFSRYFNVDASPEITTIKFPDGYQEQFFNVAYIPSVTHQSGN
jgi:hypothetical protein